MVSHIFSVTSLEEGRISLLEDNGDIFVTKRTTSKELCNLTRVKRWLVKNDTFTGANTKFKFRISVPRVIKWIADDNTLVMEYCKGVNLEIEIMRQHKRRRFYINMLADILNWIKSKSFYWRDFAPRNIIFDSKSRTIFLVDFESPLVIGRKMMTEKKYNLFVQNKIMLELATILFHEEQNYLCPNVWKYYERKTIPVKEILGKRRRAYILLKHPGISAIKHRNLVEIEEKIISIASPFIYKNTIFYPLISLSKIDSVEHYISVLTQIESKEKSLWSDLIENALNS
ncbi:MAG: AarF/UbiB family protein [Pyrinomonadaceae bacterium]